MMGAEKTHSQPNTHKIDNQTHTHEPPPLAHDMSGWLEGDTNPNVENEY